MQIHEITKKSKLDEGILDGVKSAVTAATTGYKGQGAAGGKGVSGAFKALGSKQAYTDAQSDLRSQQIEKLAPAVQQRLDQAALSQARRSTDAQQFVARVKQSWQNRLTQLQSRPEPEPVQTQQAQNTTPPKGRALQVAIQDGARTAEYYKLDDGQWISGEGKVIPAQQIKTIDFLEKQAANGKTIPANLTPGYDERNPEPARASRRVSRTRQGGKIREATESNFAGGVELLKLLDLELERQFPGWTKIQHESGLAKQLNAKADALEQMANNGTVSGSAFEQALSDYLTFAYAAGIAANKSQTGQQNASDPSTETGREAQQFDTITDQLGLSQYQLKKLGQELGTKNQTVSATNNPMLNKLLQTLGARLS